MAFLKAGDTISGQEAVARMTIKNPGGTTTVEEMFWDKDLEAKCDIQKSDVKTLGKRGVQHKPNSWLGTGSMNVYYVTSLFREMALQYIKTGVPVYFDIMVTNNDPSSTVGAQTTLIKNCTIDSVILSKFDVDSDVLDESLDFTFDDAEILDVFGTPILGS